MNFGTLGQMKQHDRLQRAMEHELESHMLLSRSSQDQDRPPLDQTTRYVAIRIPELSATSAHATVLWIRATSPSQPVDISKSVIEYVEMPQDIEYREQCIITCTDMSDEWDPWKLIRALFLRMPSNDMIRSKTDNDSNRDDSGVRISDIRWYDGNPKAMDAQKMDVDHQSSPSFDYTLFPIAIPDIPEGVQWRLEQDNLQKKPPTTSSTPTRYIISFPSKRQASGPPFSICPITIEIIRPFLSLVTHLIFTEYAAHMFQGCIVEVEHTYSSLKLDLLVQDIGAITGTSAALDLVLPYPLSHGGTITQFKSPSIIPNFSDSDLQNMNLSISATRPPQDSSFRVRTGSLTGLEPTRFINQERKFRVPSLQPIPQSKTLYRFVFPSTTSSHQVSKVEETPRVIITVKRERHLPEIVMFPAPRTQSTCEYRHMCTLVLETTRCDLDEFSLAVEFLLLGIGTTRFDPPSMPLPWVLQDDSIIQSYEFSTNHTQRASNLRSVEVLDSVLQSFNLGQSPISNFASPASFMTASPASYMTARSNYNSPAFVLSTTYSPMLQIETIRENEANNFQVPAIYQRLHLDYFQALQGENIIQPFDMELNWSGKGQHVAFLPQDEVPLTYLTSLGSSLTAKVDKVLCRRIALARKTMKCSRQWTVADALREVYHLQNLQHFHIVQLVGSYVQKRTFSILMYPVADCHLGTFLEETCDTYQDPTWTCRVKFLASSLCCLTSALAFVHDNTTKHMDIKPQNILVRGVPNFKPDWRVYLADFGLSRSFASQGHSQTDGPTSRTPRYCAPEVYKYERRGRSSDIFSLGCVFLEILTVYCGTDLQDFADFRRGDSDNESFHANLARVHDWTQDKLIGIMGPYLGSDPEECLEDHVFRMVSEAPHMRPTAAALISRFHLLKEPHEFAPKGCCDLSPEPYVAWEDPAKTSAMAFLPNSGNTFTKPGLNVNLT